MASALAGNLPLGRVGVGGYALLLACALAGAQRVAAAGVALAIGAHLTLLATLLRHRVRCVPCVLTGACAGGALAFALAMHPRDALRMVLLMALASAGAGAVLRAIRLRQGREYLAECERMLGHARDAAGPRPIGRAILIVYGRDGCAPCDLMKQEYQPALEGLFPNLRIEHRPAGPGMPTPALAVLGDVETPFLGLPPLDAVAQAVGSALREPVPGAFFRLV